MAVGHHSQRDAGGRTQTRHHDGAVLHARALVGTVPTPIA